MIRLFTGLPGAGKTAHAVSVALDLMAQGRPVYVSNMNGMNIPGAIPFEDPRKWEELPSNAVLIVDEAQRFWRATRSLDVPPEVLAMETHRHLGIDFLLTTQQPTYLLKHLRGLVGEHTHHLRRTKSSAQTWTWNGCCDDPDHLPERDRADVSMFVYPKKVFGMYTSTEHDTHRPGIPRKWKFVGLVALLMLAMFIWGPDYLKSKTIKSSSIQSTQADGLSAEPPSGGQVDATGKRSLSAAQYAALMVPRIEGALHTAPMFDGKKVVSDPAVYCITSEAGMDAEGKHQPAHFTCLTEQGTRFEVPAIRAQLIARFGPAYNPYKQPVQAQPQAPELPQPKEPASPRAGLVSAAMPAMSGVPVAAPGSSFGDVAAYGAHALATKSQQ